MSFPHSAPLWVWICFNAFVLMAIFVDLFMLHRESKVMGLKQSLLTSAAWVCLALLFNLSIYFYKGKEAALNFLAGYLIEESLSIDNLFIFLMLFSYFRAPAHLHYKVLFWGILGAIAMRASMIFFGLSLVHAFHWTFYIFGIFLIYTAIRIAYAKAEPEFKENPLISFLKRIMRLTPHYEEDRFFIKKPEGWHATPLFILLLTVESTDLIFALDSIPAVMAITTDPFIVYTSNIFAILGLRSVYFSLASLIPLFHFLNYALAAILAFVGAKMLLKPFIEIPIGLVLSVIGVCLASAILASLYFPQKKA